MFCSPLLDQMLCHLYLYCSCRLSLSKTTRNILYTKFCVNRIKTVVETAVHTDRQTDRMPIGPATETSLRSVNNNPLKFYSFNYYTCVSRPKSRYRSFLNGI